MKGETRTELEQHLMDTEEVQILIGPGEDEPLAVAVNYGKYGKVETNPYHRIAAAWISTLNSLGGS